MRKENQESFITMMVIISLLVTFAFFVRPSPAAYTSKHAVVSLSEASVPAYVGQLRSVQVAFRHGARTPLSTMYWPDTTWVNCRDSYEGVKLSLVDENGSSSPPPILDLGAPKLPGGCRMGQLTINGYRMAKNLGRWLQKRYVSEFNFLPIKYEAKSLSARSTCIDRTYKTLQGVLTGLYPSLTEVVPVNASVEAHEIMYGKNTTCERLGPMFAELQDGLNAKDLLDRALQALATKVAYMLNLEDKAAGTHNVSWIRLHDTLAAMEADNLTLPVGASTALLDMVSENAINHEAAIIAPRVTDKLEEQDFCSETIRLSIGPLFHRVLANMRAAAAQPDECHLGLLGGRLNCPPRLFLFAGHDSTITPLIVAMGAPLQLWPRFASNVVFELWVNHEEARQFVRVLYDGEVLPLKRAATDGFMRLEDFEALLKPFVISDADKPVACAVPRPPTPRRRALVLRGNRYRRMEPSL